MKKLLTIFILALISQNIFAHEPLYGFGPHVLFKGGWAPHFTTHFNSSFFETEYALGYGITPKLTAIGEVSFSNENNVYAAEYYSLKSKYRFYLNNQPGFSHQVALIGKLSVPAESGNPGAFDLAITGGREGLRFYWFASAGYGVRFADNPVNPGDRFIYNLSLGYRPFKVSYYKPDLVLFVETTGFTYQKSKMDGEPVQDSGGSNLAVAPTFFFSYRNLALRGGVQFGLWDNKFVTKPDTNFKITIELHI